MKKLLLATAAVLCFARPATAEEWRNTPAQQKDSYFSVRMGASRLNVKMEREKEHKSLFMMSGAFGTKIAQDVRAEVEIMATNNLEKTEIGIGERYEYKHSVGNFSLNFLKDFDAGSVKPYVGAGVGFGSFTDDLNYNIAGVVQGRKKVSNTVMSGNIQAGVAVPLTDTVSFDFNARYTCFGGYEIKLFGNKIKMKNNTADVSAGLRFAF